MSVLSDDIRAWEKSKMDVWTGIFIKTSNKASADKAVKTFEKSFPKPTIVTENGISLSEFMVEQSEGYYVFDNVLGVEYFEGRNEWFCYHDDIVWCASETLEGLDKLLNIDKSNGKLEKFRNKKNG